MDPTDTLSWLERPLAMLIQYLRSDLADYLAVIENLPSKKHDISMDAARLLMEAITKAYLPNEPRLKNRLAGLFRRAATKLDRFVKDSAEFPGLSYLIETLTSFSDALASPEKRAAAG